MEKERIPDEILEMDEENDQEITTSVDRLLDLLKKTDKMALEDAAKSLGVSLDVVQSWVDFLVEEQIVGIEYKFTKPFIYLNKSETPQEEEEKEEKVSLELIKKQFVEKAQAKNIPLQNINYLWGNHVQQALEKKKDLFMKEVSKRGLANQEELWKNYTKRIAVVM